MSYNHTSRLDDAGERLVDNGGRPVELESPACGLSREVFAGDIRQLPLAIDSHRQALGSTVRKSQRGRVVERREFDATILMMKQREILRMGVGIATGHVENRVAQQLLRVRSPRNKNSALPVKQTGHSAKRSARIVYLKLLVAAPGPV